MTYNPLIIHDKSPFKETVERKVKTSTDSDKGMILNEEVVITRKRQYLNMPWIRLTQDKEKLRHLTPHEWYIIGYIALNITWNQEQIKLSRKDIGMTKPMFRRSMLNLLVTGIIANAGKREWYWINVGLMIMGSVGKEER